MGLIKNKIFNYNIQGNIKNSILRGIQLLKLLGYKNNVLVRLFRIYDECLNLEEINLAPCLKNRVTNDELFLFFHNFQNTDFLNFLNTSIMEDQMELEFYILDVDSVDLLHIKQQFLKIKKICIISIAEGFISIKYDKTFYYNNKNCIDNKLMQFKKVLLN